MRGEGRRLYVISFLSMLFLWLPSAALGSGGEAHHAPSIDTLIFPVINFSLYIFILYMVLRKPLAKKLAERREGMRNFIEEAAEKKTAAVQKLLMTQRKFQKLDDAIVALRERIENEGRSEALNIVDEARLKATQIKERARELAEIERRASEASLRREMVDLVVELATQKISSRLTPELDQGLRQSLLDDVGKALGE
ncbi:MAG: hypothetical protein D6808_03275 [Candidatus Dadabacteria bacterium]|nr:MAG: hypothetical protein D6808_03275 [Candidatus Dadabacteria bacterium]